MDNIEIDTKRFIKQGLHYKIADFLYTKLIGPVVLFFESLSARATAKWCESKIPENERVK